MTTLSPRQQKFLDHYHNSFNPVESWRAAGLRPEANRAVVESAQALLLTDAAKSYLVNLNQVAISSASDEAKGAVVIKELTAIALSKITDVCSWDSAGNISFNASATIDPVTQSAIETLRIEATQFGPKIMVKMHSKQTALTTLANHYSVGIDVNALLDRVRSFDYEPIDTSVQSDE